jgi:uncharacterized protein (TIGR03435 family)
MKLITLMLGMVVIAVAGVGAAQAPAQKLAFEVASIKQSVFRSDGAFAGTLAAGGMCGQTRLSISGNRVTLRQVSLCGLIAMAYDMRDFLIVPVSNGWIKKEDRSLFYEIETTAPDDGKQPTPEQAREMLRTLLADRLQLKVHTEMKEMSIYALIVGKDGPKLKLGPKGPCAEHPNARLAFSVSVGPGGQQRGGGSIESCKGVTTMQQLVVLLSPYTDRPVVDRTGLEGGQVFELRWSADGAGQADVPSLFTALQEQLGLKLESSKGPVEVLVIDSVSRPTEN